MPVPVKCPNPACGSTCHVAEDAAGPGVECPRCGTKLTGIRGAETAPSDTRRSRPAASPGDAFPALPAQFGRYRVLRLLGRGGMGAVYLAEDTELGRRVALKLPAFGPAESPLRAERFVREAQSAAGLQHPNLCTVFDAGRIEGRPFLTMTYVDGASLEAAVDADAPLPQARAADIARKVALAMAYAHGRGVVHRDLKPANVMLSADGEPVVMDFGLAKRVAESGPLESKLTRDGAVLGTPGYMAPEQVRGEAGVVGPAADVYALGVMLFEMLTGRLPYRGSLGEVLGQILAAPVPPVSEFRADVDPRLDAACRTAMAKDPADRFPTMAAFAAALAVCCSGPLPQAVPASRPEAVSSSSVFAVPDTDLSPAGLTPGRRRSASPHTRRVTGGVLGLVAVVSALAAAGVFTAKPRGGTVVVENLPEGAEILVNSEAVAATRRGDQATVALNGRGPHNLKVVLGGKEVYVTDLAAAVGGQPIRVRVENPDGAKAGPVKGPPEATPGPVPKPEITALHVLTGHKAAVRQVLFTPDGSRVVSGSYGNYVEKSGLKQPGPDNSVRVWNVAAGKQVRHFDFTAPRVTGVQGLAVSPDGRFVAACTSWDSQYEWMCPWVYVWQIDTGERKQFYQLREQVKLHAVGFADGGATLRVAHAGKVILSWPGVDGTERSTVDYDKPVVPRVFSADGRYAFGGDPTGGVWVLDAMSGKKVAVFAGHVKPLTSVAVSQDRRWLLTASADYSVRLWEVDTGREVRALTGLDAVVTAVAVFADGTRFVTADGGGAVRLWDVASGNEIAQSAGHAGKVHSVAVSPDGRFAASAGADTTVRVWRLPPP